MNTSGEYSTDEDDGTPVPKHHSTKEYRGVEEEVHMFLP